MLAVAGDPDGEEWSHRGGEVLHQLCARHGRVEASGGDWLQIVLCGRKWSFVVEKDKKTKKQKPKNKKNGRCAGGPKINTKNEVCIN